MIVEVVNLLMVKIKGYEIFFSSRLISFKLYFIGPFHLPAHFTTMQTDNGLIEDDREQLWFADSCTLISKKKYLKGSFRF